MIEMTEGGSREAHWNRVHGKAPETLSWYQAEPTLSLQLIGDTGFGSTARILDVGGGTSFLVDRLLDSGYSATGVLDVSEVAIERARIRLGERARKVEWFREDVTRFVSPHEWDIWHDRAVFHFLTEAQDRAAYRAALFRSLSPGGQVILATFGPTGPEVCSGLPAVRYSATSLRRELGAGLTLLESTPDSHVTPGGAAQDFMYFRLGRTA